MKYFLRIIIIGFLISSTLLHPIVAAAQTPLDVSVTVAPASTSIYTSFSSFANHDTVSQGEEITYTLQYSSTNTGTIPLSLKVSWDKGKADGASTANIELAEYVIGSATTAYGDTAPIVDTKNRSITWDIQNLPKIATQTVQFKLRMSSTYTGSKVVTLPVKAVVLSPVGVPDKLISREYKYLETTIATATPTPTPISTLSNNAVPSAPAQKLAEIIKTIEVRSLGAISARIGVSTQTPATLVLRYGQSISNLGNGQVQIGKTTEQEFILVGLQPQSKYFFQISNRDSSSVSDIFTITTTNHVSDPNSVEAKNVTISQQQTLLYSGQPPGKNGETSQPIVIPKRSVVDLSVSLPKSKNVNIFDVLIRSAGVLGITTDESEINQQQSTTTRMTWVTADLFVGKLRTPIQPGQYEVVGRVEDIYGNISEQPLGEMNVVSPFTIFDKETGIPISHAKVHLFHFNERSNQYEELSNLTTSLINPTYSDQNGVVELNLFPGKFKAEISIPGYESQEVIFDVGSDSVANMPQILLQPRSGFFNGYVSFFLGYVNQLKADFLVIFQQASYVEPIYSFLLIYSSILFVISSLLSIALYRYPHLRIEYWMIQNYPHLWQKVGMWIGYLGVQAITFCGEFFALISLLFGVLYYIYFQSNFGSLLLLINIALLLLWCFDLIFFKIHREQEKN